MTRLTMIAVLALAACGVDGPPERPLPSHGGTSIRDDSGDDWAPSREKTKASEVSEVITEQPVVEVATVGAASGGSGAEDPGAGGARVGALDP